MEFKTKNPFIANLAKYAGRDVVVAAKVEGKLVEYTGYCENIDFFTNRVILKTSKGTLMLTDVFSVFRVSPYAEPDKKKKGDKK